MNDGNSVQTPVVIELDTARVVQQFMQRVTLTPPEIATWNAAMTDLQEAMNARARALSALSNGASTPNKEREHDA